MRTETRREEEEEEEGEGGLALRVSRAQSWCRSRAERSRTASDDAAPSAPSLEAARHSSEAASSRNLCIS